MNDAIAQLLVKFAYAMLPPHMQVVARPFYDIAVSLIAAGLEELQLQTLLEDLLANQRKALHALASR